MIRARRYIGSLLENVTEGQISSDEHRLVFGKIKERLAQAEDFEAELKKLYGVRGFADFALSLFWLAERVENDFDKLEYTAEEQEFILAQFRAAVGDAGPIVTTPPVSSEEPALAEPEVLQEAPAAEELPEMPSQLQMEVSGTISESEKAVYAPPPGAAADAEKEFPPLMEKFVESMQSGSDDRETLLASVLDQCAIIAPEGSGADNDLRQFCALLVEFLNYIKENGFMDDVRVMNILSNVSAPVSSWAQADTSSREGLLTEGIEILRTFKSLFE